MAGKIGVMKLNKEQRAYLLELIAQGLNSTEINELTTKWEKPFDVSRSLVHHYRTQHDLLLKEKRAEFDAAAVTTGLALRFRRVEVLSRLVDRMISDYEDKMWTDQVKGIGSGDDFERIEYKEFNAAQIKEIRGLLDDLAKETGGRVSRTDVTTDGKPIKAYVGVSPDDWDKPVDTAGTADTADRTDKTKK